MDRFYKFFDGDTTKESYAYGMMSELENISSGLSNATTSHMIWESPVLLQLDLVPLYEDLISEKQFKDMITMRSDITRKTAIFTRLIRLITPELKTFLEQFILSPQGFYPVTLTHDLTKESRDYYLWHTLNIIFDDVNFLASQFKLLTRKGGNVEKVYTIGEIPDRNSLKEIRRKLVKEAIYSIEPVQLVYLQPYEVLPAGVDDIVISEKVKQAMEKAFPSMEFHEFTDYQIITGYQA